MALIACPKCGKIVSDMEETCPYCGGPTKESKAVVPVPKIKNTKKAVKINKAVETVKTNKDKSKIGLLFIAAVVVIVAILFFSSNASKNTQERKLNKAYTEGKEYLKNHEFGRAELVLSGISGYKDTEEILETLDETRDSYIEQKAKEAKMEAKQLDSPEASFVYTRAVQAISDTFKIIHKYDKEVEIDPDELKEDLAKNMDQLNYALIGLRSIEDSPNTEVDVITQEGEIILTIIRDYIWENMESFSSYYYVYEDDFREAYYDGLIKVTEEYAVDDWIEKTNVNY